MIYGHLSVKNQIMPGKYHHRNNACALRFSSNRMEGWIAAPAQNDNRGPQ